MTASYVIPIENPKAMRRVIRKFNGKSTHKRPINVISPSNADALISPRQLLVFKAPFCEIIKMKCN